MWNRSFKSRMRQMTELRELAEQGLKLLEAETPERRRRLELMRDMNAFMEREFPKLLAKWEEEKKVRGYDDLG